MSVTKCISAASQPTPKTRAAMLIKVLSVAEDLYLDVNAKNIGDMILHLSKLPNLAAARRDPLAWVCLAVGTDENRPHICRAHSDGEWVAATDGHRIHRAQLHLPLGSVCPYTLEPLGIPAEFPLYEQCIPRYHTQWDIVSKGSFIVDEDEVHLATPQGDVYYNKNYVYEALAGMREAYVSLAETRPMDPLVLESIDGKRQAVIMPKRSK